MESRTEMIESSSLDILEEKIVREYQQDGMAPVLFGGWLLWISAVLLLWPGPPLWALAFYYLFGAPMYFIGKAWRHKIGYPRLGFIQLTVPRWSMRESPATRHLVKRLMVRALVIGVLFGVITPVSSFLGYLSGFRGIIPGVFNFGEFTAPGLLATMLILWSNALSRKAFSWLTVIALLLVSLGRFFQISNGWAVGAFGLLLLGIGLFQLRRFLREYPVIEGEPDGSH
jgi:hypothetical protein